jgi:hypothetical protein
MLELERLSFFDISRKNPESMIQKPERGKRYEKV